MQGSGPDETDTPPAVAEIDRLAQLDNLARLAIARAAPDDLPDGLEHDSDDERAVLIGGWIGEELAAAARMIFPAPAQRLPVEAVYDLVVEPRGHVVHVDRVTVARAHSDPGSRMLLGLIGRCWLEMRERGFHVWAGIDSPGTIRLYRRLGFDVAILGPAKRYWDEERYPVRFDPVAAAATIRSRHAAAVDDLARRE